MPILYVALCSSYIRDDKRETVDLQCAWSQDCVHHKDDISRGRARRGHQMLNSGRTPNEVFLQVVKTMDPVAIAVGNRTYGSLKRETVRRQQFLRRNEEYCRGSTVAGSLAETARELAEDELKLDPGGAHSIYGSLHDVTLMSTGDVNSVSIYSSLALRIAAEEIKGNGHATAVIDCTGGLVSPIWISSASEMAIRASKRKSKKPKKCSSDGKSVLFDVLNFHLVFSLPTGPFVACEAVVVGRTATTFHDVLLMYRRSLGLYGANAQDIKYFVSDMATPFAIAVVEVFNRLNLPEYMAVLAFSAKARDLSIASKHIKTRLIWCSVHGDRAMRDFARDAFKQKSVVEQQQMISLFRNIRMALFCAKSYNDLCAFVGFLDRFISLPTLKTVSKLCFSQSETVISTEMLVREGEELIWGHLGGIPVRTDSEYLHTVKVKACYAKGYNPSYYENTHLNPSEDGRTSSDNVPENVEMNIQASTDASSKEKHDADEEKLLNGLKDAEKGVYTYRFGPFDVHVVFRENDDATLKTRYRVYIPSLSLLPGTIGGFNVWCNSLDPQSKETGFVSNQAGVGGKASAYLRNQWYSNLTLICPSLIGDFPLSHNTSVELSYKIAKNHTDLGLLARQLSGLKITEYVKRAALSRRQQARNVSAELSSFYRQQKEDKRKSRAQYNRGEETKFKKRKTLHTISKQLDPVFSNMQLVKEVFISKRRIASDETAVQVEDYQDHDDVPATQKSQAAASTVEEAWSKSTRRGNTMSLEEQESFRQLLREVRDTYFQGWSLRKIGDFLSDTALHIINRKIDKSALSRICANGKLPGRALCAELEDYLQGPLLKRTVYHEGSFEDFELIPGAERRVRELVQSSHVVGIEQNMLSKLGDTEFRFEDALRLVRPEKWSGEESQFWISDNAVNLMTNLFSALLFPMDAHIPQVYYFSSFFSQPIRDLHFGVGAYHDVLDNEKTKSRDAIIAKMAVPRSGQQIPFSASQVGFAPCHVNENHWVGIQMDKTTRRVVCLDSKMNDSDAWREKEYAQSGKFIDSGDKYGEAFVNFLSILEGQDWEYQGKLLSFPQQLNSMDCGVIMLIAAKACLSGSEVCPSMMSEQNLSKWRLRFAHEIIVLQSS